jgi:hypothetical protein
MAWLGKNEKKKKNSESTFRANFHVSQLDHNKIKHNELQKTFHKFILVPFKSLWVPTYAVCLFKPNFGM